MQAARTESLELVLDLKGEATALNQCELAYCNFSEPGCPFRLRLLMAAHEYAGKLLESPAWDGRQERLVFVDTDGQNIYRFDPLAAADAPDRYVRAQMSKKSTETTCWLMMC